MDPLLLFPCCRQENQGLKASGALALHAEPGLCSLEPLLPPKNQKTQKSDGGRQQRRQIGVQRGFHWGRGSGHSGCKDILLLAGIGAVV